MFLQLVNRPTHDDITAKSIAKAFKVKYEYHKEAYEILENYYGKKKLLTVEKWQECLEELN